MPSLSQGFTPLCVAVYRAELPGDAATQVLESLIAAGGDTSSPDDKGLILTPCMLLLVPLKVAVQEP